MIVMGAQQRTNDLVGRLVDDVDVVPVGQVRDVLLDSESGIPAWLLVGRRAQSAHAVPLSRAWLRRGRMVLAARVDDVQEAPTVGLDTDVDHRTERQLLAYWASRPMRDPVDRD